MTKPRMAVQPRQKPRRAMPERERLPFGRNSGAMALGDLRWMDEASLARTWVSSSGVQRPLSEGRLMGREMSMFDVLFEGSRVAMVGGIVVVNRSTSWYNIKQKEVLKA